VKGKTLTELSDRILKLTITFIGPASQKFLERQTVSHLNGLSFNTIEKKDIPELAKWVNISAGLLIGPAKAQDLASKISALI
jgi:hypothetical protein